jgi:hypothetical protein
MDMILQRGLGVRLSAFAHLREKMPAILKEPSASMADHLREVSSGFTWTP